MPSPSAGAVSGGVHLDRYSSAKSTQCLVYPIWRGAMAWIEHAADHLLVDSEGSGEGDASQATLLKGDHKRGLCCHARRHRDRVFAGLGYARKWNRLSIVDASGQGFVERVDRGGECFGSVRTGGEACSGDAWSLRGRKS